MDPSYDDNYNDTYFDGGISQEALDAMNRAQQAFQESSDASMPPVSTEQEQQEQTSQQIQNTVTTPTAVAQAQNQSQQTDTHQEHPQTNVVYTTTINNKTQHYSNSLSKHSLGSELTKNQVVVLDKLDVKDNAAPLNYKDKMLIWNLIERYQISEDNGKFQNVLLEGLNKSDNLGWSKHGYGKSLIYNGKLTSEGQDAVKFMSDAVEFLSQPKVWDSINWDYLQKQTWSEPVNSNVLTPTELATANSLAAQKWQPTKKDYLQAFQKLQNFRIGEFDYSQSKANPYLKLTVPHAVTATTKNEVAQEPIEQRKPDLTSERLAQEQLKYTPDDKAFNDYVANGTKKLTKQIEAKAAERDRKYTQNEIWLIKAVKQSNLKMSTTDTIKMFNTFTNFEHLRGNTDFNLGASIEYAKENHAISELVNKARAVYVKSLAMEDSPKKQALFEVNNDYLKQGMHQVNVPMAHFDNALAAVGNDLGQNIGLSQNKGKNMATFSMNSSQYQTYANSVLADQQVAVQKTQQEMKRTLKTQYLDKTLKDATFKETLAVLTQKAGLGILHMTKKGLNALKGRFVNNRTEKTQSAPAKSTLNNMIFNTPDPGAEAMNFVQQAYNATQDSDELEL